MTRSHATPPDPDSPRPKRVTARWAIVMVTLFVTWAGFAYLLYSLIKGSKL